MLAVTPPPSPSRRSDRRRVRHRLRAVLDPRLVPWLENRELEAALAGLGRVHHGHRVLRVHTAPLRVSRVRPQRLHVVAAGVPARGEAFLVLVS